MSRLYPIRMEHLQDEGELRPHHPRGHWDDVWGGADPDRVSWFEPLPEISLRLILSSGVGLEGSVIDIGGGASLLTRCLLEEGYRDLAVLDVSSRGLTAGRSRLGPDASRVEWIEADVRRFEPSRVWDLWHDRAVFHFLTEPDDRAAYRASLERALAPRGLVVLATFGPDGPSRCSGLEVRRYSADGLAEELGAAFALEESLLRDHTTPAGASQQFLYARFRHV